MNRRILFPLLLVVLLAGAVRAGEQQGWAEKAGYHLFNPTPRAQMRELNTDRPDKTESPYTVDAGHFQIESDLVSYSYDRHNSERTNTRVDEFSFAAANLKVGLLNWMDLQLVVESFRYVRTRESGVVDRRSGFGDLTVRLKMNVWGNDGGTTALALMPFAKLPTNQDKLGNDAVEGGLIVPLTVEFPRGWEMGVMTEFDSNEDGDADGYHTEFINTITFSHDIMGKLSGYVEFFSLVSAEPGSDWVGTIDLGLTYTVTEDVQLDAGINIGVTRAADDLNPFLGWSVRF
jgi:hypothetical protein